MQQFNLERTSEIKLFGGTLYEYRHAATKAPVLLLKNEDPNRAFTMQLRTLPESDNGIMHILEHAVLSGSQKFDIREPFSELLKGSLNTFLNAMTFTDRTVYPFSTINETEFYHLLDIYLDGVFFPSIYNDERILGQEGWHYELSPKGELSISGVVYNEMQGLISQPDMRLAEGLQSALYDNEARFNPGGLPSAIPSLTQEEFLRYHSKYYHPANASLFFYGDLNIEDILERVGEVFERFEPQEKPADLEKTPAFTSPRRAEMSYPVSKREPRQASFGLAFAQEDCTDLPDNLAMKLLVDMLFSMESSPIRTMLLDSNLVTDVFAYYDDGLQQPMTLVGFKGLERDEADLVQEAIFFELERLAEEGLDPELITAALNQWKFRLRSGFQEGSASRGIAAGIDVLASLDRGVAAADRFAYEKNLEAVEEKINEGYLKELIRTQFLENQHRVSGVLSPDEKMQEREEKAFQEEMRQRKEAMSEEELQEIVRFSEALAQRQKTPDDPEKLAKLPSLRRSDLSEETESLGLEWKEEEGIYALKSQSRGISALSLFFPMDDPGEENLFHVGALALLLGNLATKKRSQTTISNDLMKYTGSFNALPRIKKMPQGLVLGIQFEIRYLDEYREPALELLFEILQETDFSNASRIETLLRAHQTSFEGFLMEEGDMVAAERLSAQFEAPSYFLQKVDGIDALLQLKELLQDPSRIESDVIPSLKSLSASLLSEDRVIAIYQGESLGETAPILKKALQALPTREEALALAPFTPYEKKEIFIAPMSLSFAAKGMNFIEQGYAYSGALHVAKQLLENTYLWENVRVLGGAYGVGMNLKYTGHLSATSYRDPKPAATLETFRGIRDYLKNLTLSERELEKLIIGAYGALTKPLIDEMRLQHAYDEVFDGFTEEHRARIRAEVLEVKLNDLSSLHPLFDALAKSNQEVLLSSKRLSSTVGEGFEITTI